MEYMFEYKKTNWIFWKVRKVIGHGIDFVEEKYFESGNVIKVIRKPLNAMILYYKDGSIERIPEWDKYQMKLGSDWKLALKTQMEDETGTNIKVK